MKKNFFKKLASGLALAMVVTSFAPAAPAFAATATKIVEQGGKKAPQTVYVGKKVDYSLNNVYKTNTYKWFTSNAKIAKITQTGGIVTPVAPGKATIKVNAYKKSTGKLIKAFKLDLDVKLRATSVNIGAEDFELAVGEKKDLDAVKTPANSTDTLRYFSSNEKVATVDTKTGIVTAVAAGEATIKVASKGAWFTANNSKYNKYDEVKVTVVDGLLKAEQKAYNKIELTYSSDMEKAGLKVTDFSIVRDETNRVLPVKSVSVDGKMVTLTTFENMTDAKVYTVTHAGDKVQFTATDNVVASLSIHPVTITFNEETDVYVSTVDAKGVVLGDYTLTNASANRIDFAIETTQGYTNGNKLRLFATGNTAKATATYHTDKYDANGNEIGAIKLETTITAVDKAASNFGKYQYTISDKTPNWNLAVTTNTRLAIGDAGYGIYLNVKDTNGNTISLTGYTYESSNADVLLVYGDRVQAVAEGAAYVLVKDPNGNVVLSLPVTIVAKRVAASVTVDKATVSVSNTSAVSDEKVVNVVIKDQYGDKMNSEVFDKIEIISAPTGVDKSNFPYSNYVSPVGNELTFKGMNNAPGTYTFRVSKKSFGQTINVVIQKAATPTEVNSGNLTPGYSLVVDTDTIDTTFVSGDTAGNRVVSIKVARLFNNVLYDYVTLQDSPTATTIDDNGGNIVISKGGVAVTGSAITTTATGSAIEFVALDTTNNKFAKKAAGSYSVRVDYVDNGRTYNLSSGFVVTDSQPAVTFKRNEIVNTQNLKASSSDADVVNAYFTFYYEGKQVTAAQSSDFITAKSTQINNSGLQRYFGTITVYVDVDGYRVPVAVNLNQTIQWY
jgi:hypothetical protein